MLTVYTGRRTLSERHANMIAFSSVVGIGLFLQAGKIISYAGPGCAVFAYLITGSVMWAALACLGEMTALFPVKGALFDFPGRFLDKAVGYTVGWMAW
jgi:yeast amino acid transporter